MLYRVLSLNQESWIYLTQSWNALGSTDQILWEEEVEKAALCMQKVLAPAEISWWIQTYYLSSSGKFRFYITSDLITFLWTTLKLHIYILHFHEAQGGLWNNVPVWLWLLCIKGRRTLHILRSITRLNAQAQRWCLKPIPEFGIGELWLKFSS